MVTQQNEAQLKAQFDRGNRWTIDRSNRETTATP
jgi:hypothetical protein